MTVTGPEIEIRYLIDSYRLLEKGLAFLRSYNGYLATDEYEVMLRRQVRTSIDLFYFENAAPASANLR